MAVSEVNEHSNLPETEQAIRENSAALHQAVVEENAIRSEVQIQEGQQKDNLAKADNIDAAPSEGEAQTQGNAKSTEGGVYADVALEASGVGAGAKLLKDGVEIFRDMDPGKFGGAQTMENFAAPKAGRSIQGSFVSDLFARFNLARESVHGEVKIKGAQADESVVSCLKNTQQMRSVLSLDALHHLGKAHAHKAALGGQSYDARMAPGGNMGGGRAPHLALNEMKPKGPSQEMLEETGQA